MQIQEKVLKTSKNNLYKKLDAEYAQSMMLALRVWQIEESLQKLRIVNYFHFLTDAYMRAVSFPQRQDK